jgi:DNA-directed RNA polymerase specialized sigma24 family protein
VIGVLRSKRRNPYSEEPLATESLDERIGEPSIDGRADARANLSRIYERLEQRLDERGLMLFHMLYVEQRSVEEVCELSSMTRDAVYAWRFRFKKILNEIKSEAAQ